MRFDPPVGNCPACSDDNVRTYATMAKNGVEVVCSRGHSFKDLNDFNSGVTKSERKKMKKDNDDKANEIFGSGLSDPGTVPAIIKQQDSDIVIDEINKARIESLLGQFTDASSLVGLIYSMNKEKEDLSNIIKDSRKAKVGEEDGIVLPSGDLKIIGIIPERHVQPLIDLSHSWNRNVTDYINERLVELFDGMMFY
jgi:hypothetical protein